MLDIDNQKIVQINTIIMGKSTLSRNELLDSALSTYHYYPDIKEQICSAVRGIIKNHPF